MLSHLRFHRRGSSNPTSPITEQASPRDIQQQQQRDGAPSPDVRPSSSSSPLLSPPPTLPPISTSSGPSFDLPDFSTGIPQPRHPPREPPRQERTLFSRDPSRDHPRPAPMRSPYDQGTGFIGGVALQKYRRAEEAARRQESSDLQASDTQHPPTPSRTVPLSTSPAMPVMNKPSTSFVTPTDLRNSGASPTGRLSLSNVRGPEPFPHAVVVSPMEPSRGKKGLPFLKNPMSTLLMRRKAVQNVPDLLPIRSTAEPEYDPRIRGTRVHDFSAPRPRKHAPQAAARAPPIAPQHPVAKPPPIPGKSQHRPPVEETAEDPGQSNPGPGRPVSSGTNSAHLTVAARTDAPSARLNDASSVSSNPFLHPSLDRPLPPRASPPIVPPKDNASAAATRSSAASTAAHPSTRSRPEPGHNASVKSARSGGLARVGILSRESFSSIPKHMKSTSSRFSFDMIGAAKQEKLLEDRHRQRQLELGATGPSNAIDEYRDSRFDDLDDYDYDAMMDDDGLEEPIPGVNADYEEEPIPGMEDDYEDPIPGVNIDYDGEIDDYGGTDDPDNDQENFAGFVFERSPRSGLQSPNSAGLMMTPRDVDGEVIGFAFSEDSPLGRIPSPVPEPLSVQPATAKDSDLLPGLGLPHLAVPDAVPDRTANMSEAVTTEDPPMTNGLPREGDGRDELYFDDGMIGFDGEFADELDFSGEVDEEPFNEALFDLNDTDKYGRPIPGAFRAAKEAYATRHDQDRRESDGTSGQFDQSAMSPSTTRTSISAPGLPHAVSKAASEEISPEQRYGTISQAVPETEEDTMAVYQAALAAAAHQAVADGKFRRDSSSPQSPRPSQTEARPVSTHDPDDYDEPSDLDFDDYEKDDMLDFDLDDDDIIAEANASALANDPEGWYGHEFGFYSAPAAQGGTLPFEYSNGGYFGPSGQGAGAGGGRAVSREPNLTPITERSEYSNRNSIMSLGVPPLGSGASTSLQSPGLAQLVMMADGGGGDDMTFSALQRLMSKPWCGSQASLVSTRDGSPRSERGDGGSSPQQPQQLGVGGHHVRKGSSFSVRSREGTRSLPGSPTLAEPGLVTSPGGQNGASAQGPAGLANGAAAQSSVLPPSYGESPCEGRNPEGKNPEGRRAAKGHRHKGSAGSISYVREGEESGETRWVVERRRIDESGEEEILEREVLAGGRI